MTGVRWAESARRATRVPVETCRDKKESYFVHPIIEWSEDDVWEYIHKYDVKYCDLYDKGRSRLGCLLCCFQTPKDRERDIKEYQGYVNAYKQAFMRIPFKGEKTVSGYHITNKEEEWEWWLTQGYRKKKSAEVNSENLFEFRIDEDENFL